MSSANSVSSNHLPQPTLYLGHYPNQPIQLYQGFAELIKDEQVIEGQATATFGWFPSPCVKFEFIHFTETRIDGNDITLILTEIGSSVKVRISQRTIYSGDNRSVISGYSCETIVKSKGQELTFLVFHLPNFLFFNIFNTLGMNEEDEDEEEERKGWLQWRFDGQLAFKTGDWRIVLATLPDSWDIYELLQSQGGYSLTHICQLERLDRTPFSMNDARDLLEAFSYYLSFARGLWLAPMLIAGFDAEGTQVFEEWSACRADSWQNTDTWFDTDSTELVEAFPGFMRRWQDKNWRELVQDSIHWYVESKKQAGGVNGAIVLQQTALERLAWVLLVQDKRSLSQNGFQKLPAADQVRLLLSSLGIDLKLPTDLINLTKLANQLNWVDGPQAITEIRNAIVHYNPKNHHNKGCGSSQEIGTEAWSLGLRYLEIVLLKLFDYPYI
ncbi:hypothetical protein [Lyngbya sp. CCAP 1446/10]|uniref:hypothetical protein n=1 Tax=Lyngbya sp. CCAP 1446/10 TaxID=439293 RepID=UPI002237D43E|nr:hypothetical protein [Lyngbya sp. CCAP 1446/10]